MKKISSYIIPLITLTGLILGLGFHFSGYESFDDKAWMITLVIGSAPIVWRMLKGIFKGHFGIDLIAIVAIGASFFLNQYLAGTVILLMLSGGEALEDYALNRSTRELTRLLSLAPTAAHRKIGNDISNIKVNEIKPDHILIVKPGETVPADAAVISGISEVDEASITGESLPVKKEAGALVYSGTVNKDSVLEIRALKHAHESQYEHIIKLVKEAQGSKAPVMRLADRYAVWFTLITLLLAGGAWIVSGEPIRFLAVLVVATPCPLILATPIAIISGISKAASRGIIVKNGGALETLGEAKAMIFDKTGTLTLGEPKVIDVVSTSSAQSEAKDPNEILRIAASIDQFSAHIFARALVNYAKFVKKIRLELPKNFSESLGNGVSAQVGGVKYIFGKLQFLENSGSKISETEKTEHARMADKGNISVYLSDEKSILGYISFADVIRPEMKKVFASMQDHNLQKMIMITGDKKAVAQKIAGELGIREFIAETLPEDKVKEVKKIQIGFKPVAMVGDGVNDAPALAAADVGIALAAHGSSASSESADIVIMQNNFMRVHDAVHIAQRVMAIAKQSIFAGMGISALLMIIAALGYIPPIVGALLQEILDVAVILNALRVNFEKVD